jgi:hypothetical protein
MLTPQNILVVGASGATGRLLVEQLLQKGHHVKAIVRSASKIPKSTIAHHHLDLIIASLLDLTIEEMAQHTWGCQAIACCLGHNLTWKGIYGEPRKLVTESVRRLCKSVDINNQGEVKFVLMNTTGCSNPELDEPISIVQKIVIGLLRLLLPPHVDNEQAVNYLRNSIGKDHPVVKWVAVRPDSLIDNEKVSDYEVFPSPTRSAIFDAGKTSRINVANFMAELIDNRELWEQWQGQMPVIYNKS